MNMEEKIERLEEIINSNAIRIRELEKRLEQEEIYTENLQEQIRDNEIRIEYLENELNTKFDNM